MKKILVIGSLNLDMVMNVDHMPGVGETILCSKLDLIPGGKGANQAYAAGRLGAEVTILGAVGNDMYGELQMKSLREAGVVVSKIIRREKESTGVALITVNSEGDNSIIVASGANETIGREDIDRNIDLIKACDIVIFQMEIPVETVLYGAKKAKKFGKTVILDPAPVPKEFPKELYRYIDIIKPNETELKMLTEEADSVEAGASLLRQYGVKNVIVTLGEKGVYMNSQKEGILKIPAIKVEAVDTTAAGDAFTAALATMLSQDRNITEAITFANKISAIVVTRKGAQSSIPTLAELSEFSCKLSLEGR